MRVQARIETYFGLCFFSRSNLIDTIHGKWSDNWLMTILEEKADMGSVDFQYIWSIRLQLYLQIW